MANLCRSSEGTPAVSRVTPAPLACPELLRTSPAPHHLWHIEDAADIEWGVRLVVQNEARLIVSLCDVTVEFLVLKFTDVLWVHHPDGLQSVNPPSVKVQGEADKVTVLCYHIWRRKRHSEDHSLPGEARLLSGHRPVAEELCSQELSV